MPSIIYYPDINKPELILEFDLGLENLPVSQPGRNNQSRMETPGGAAIVQELGPRIQFLNWNIRNLEAADKTILFNFFNDTVNWSLFTFDYEDMDGNQFIGCRFWQAEDDLQQTFIDRFGESITIRVNVIKHVYAGTSPNGTILRSSDGLTWTEVYNESVDTQVISLIIFKGFIYAGTNSGRILRSSDGTIWTEVEDIGIGSVFINSLAVFNDFIYAGISPNGKILRSSDGLTWSEVYDESAEDNISSLAVFNDFIYAGTGNNGTILRSSDGLIWTEVNSDPQFSVPSLIVFNDFIYAGTSANGKILRSSDGLTWSEVYNESAEIEIHSLIVFDDFIYAGAGNNGVILRSSDGTTWIEVEDTTETDVLSLGVLTF